MVASIFFSLQPELEPVEGTEKRLQGGRYSTALCLGKE